jgi:hypothetical protein
MPRGRFKLDTAIWFNHLPAVTPAPSPNPLIALAVPLLQNVSPNKRRFNTTEDAAAAERSPAKRQNPGPRPNKSFGEA